MNSIYTLTTWIIPLLLCIILHEVAHGYVAMKLGDKTAWLMGRLNLNPMRHFDLVGSFVVPMILWLSGFPLIYGWAKPVPVDFSRLKHPKRDTGLVALAGPLANFLLAIAFILFAKLALLVLPVQAHFTQWFVQSIRNGVQLSIVMACFNLFPVLPMDGGRILYSILPKKWADKYQETEKYGLFILIGVLFILPALGLDIVNWFIGQLYPWFLRFLALFI